MKRQEYSNQYPAGENKTLQIDLLQTNVSVSIIVHEPDKVQVVYTENFSSTPTNGETQIPFGITDEQFAEQLSDAGMCGDFIVEICTSRAFLHIGNFVTSIPLIIAPVEIQQPIENCEICKQEVTNEIYHKRFILNTNNDILILDYDKDKREVICTFIIKQNGIELTFAKIFTKNDDVVRAFFSTKAVFDYVGKCADKINGCNLRFELQNNEVTMYLKSGNIETRLIIPAITSSLFPTFTQTENSFCLNLSKTERIEAELNEFEFEDNQSVSIWASQGRFLYQMNFVEKDADDLQKRRNIVFANIPNNLNPKNFFGILLKTANLMVSTKPANSTSDAYGKLEIRRTKGVGHLHVSHRDGLEFVFDLEMAKDDAEISDEESECDDVCNKPPNSIPNVTTTIYVSFDVLEPLLNELFPQFNYKNKIHLTTSPEAKHAFDQFAQINASYTIQTLFDIFKKDGGNGFSFMSFSRLDTQKAKCVMANIRMGLEEAIVEDVK
jgi:hypothetical protein